MPWSPRVADIAAIDSQWLADHPLPPLDRAADKNSRGRVLAIGGCTRVPGGLLLTGEAALRAGAGKLQLATVADVTLALGIAMPEAAVIPLPAGRDGEIADPGEGLDVALAACDTVVAGAAMTCGEAGGRIADAVLAGAPPVVVLDAGALMALGRRSPAHAGLVLTPHLGEMAALLACDAAKIEADRPAAARRAAERFGAVVALKGPNTLVAAPDGTLIAYAGGGVGLATGGSGDVLAGLVAGLAARGASPLHATAWAVWLHGEAGRRCAENLGPVGFLARELLAQVPALAGAMHHR
jgi:hydroxyethylthiazole kinase-like uncharacterized protein yjeF